MAPGAELQKWRPFPSACQTGKRRKRFSSLLAVWGGAPQPPTFLGAFGCEWNPFLNSVNTIFNLACQTGKRQSPIKGARSPSLGDSRGVWGLGGAPAANAFGSIWVLMEPIFEYR